MGWETVLGQNTMRAISEACAKVSAVTKRDVLAMTAMHGLLCGGQCTDMELNDLSVKAYALADSMLEARKQSLKKGN